MLEHRSIRVFVSSTFRDMREDRDHLVKFVFPKLRKLCEQRGVSWGEVDLRWGITDEEAAEGKVLPLCLEEIRRCRPYFIGILGERYGWVPEEKEIPNDLLEREAWLKEHLACSVTELEILRGVFSEKEMHRRAFFYFRDPAYLDRLSEERTREDFESESPEAKAKIDRLKQHIRAACDEGVCDLRENYSDPHELGNWILEDLTALIEELYPESKRPDEVDRERAAHEAFVRSRTGVYVGREEYFKQLDAHADGKSDPLVILGESGSGKSALLANWMAHYRESHRNDIMLMHFIGASAESTDWAAMVRRLMGEMKRHFESFPEIPADRDKLRAAFLNWPWKMPSAVTPELVKDYFAQFQQRVVIVIDGLNHLKDQEGALDLAWLPQKIPANCRLIVSTLSGRPLDELKKRNWRTLEVQPMTSEERGCLIHDYLLQYAKHLNESQVDQIQTRPQTANPLFLCALLEELRLFGVHEKLNERIEHYLQAETIVDLYSRILKRYEEDYDSQRPGLVRDVMSQIWTSREGLSESEILELLGENGTPLPQARWSAFHLAIEHSLIDRGGLLAFFHDYLRAAVEESYLPDKGTKFAVHRRLADCFRGKAESGGHEQWDRSNVRGMTELGYHVFEAAPGEVGYHEFLELHGDGYFEQNVSGFAALSPAAVEVIGLLTYDERPDHFAWTPDNRFTREQKPRAQ